MFNIHIGKATNNFWTWRIRMIRGAELFRFESAREDMTYQQVIEEVHLAMMGDEVMCKKGAENAPRFQSIPRLWHDQVVDDADLEGFMMENSYDRDM